MKKLGFGTMRLPLINPEDKTSIEQNYFNQLAVNLLKRIYYFVELYLLRKSEGALKKP